MTVHLPDSRSEEYTLLVQELGGEGRECVQKSKKYQKNPKTGKRVSSRSNICMRVSGFIAT